MIDDREIQKLARKMARSGRFSDIKAIERAIGKVVGETLNQLGSRGFRRQLDRFCAKAGTG